MVGCHVLALSLERAVIRKPGDVSIGQHLDCTIRPQPDRIRRDQFCQAGIIGGQNDPLNRTDCFACFGKP
jgi:hypothetical protein